MKLYSYYGFKDFVLCLGYKGEKIKEYFAENNDEDWNIEFVDTGIDSTKAERLLKIKPYIDSDSFFLAYGDDVSNVNITNLLESHINQNKMVTITSIHPQNPYGLIEIEENSAISFVEKPKMNEWVNGGFMVLKKEIFNYINEKEEIEKEIFNRLIEKKQINVYKHEGFWKSMNNLKDNQELNKLWENKNAEWKVWEDEFWENKNVFVTGGTGFIGTWLIKELVDKGANVICLVKELEKDCNFLKLNLDKKTTLIFGDMLDSNLLKLCFEKYNIDSVFHLAAQPLVQIALKKPFETININVQGTLNILECCRLNEKIKRIVVASSDKAYGSSEVLPYDESFPLKGEYPYDVSKSCTDLIAQSYGKTYGLPIAITRLSNVYGGGDFNFDRIVPETIMHILNNEDILIRSNGEFKREFFYVKDAAHAYVTLAEKVQELGLKGDAFNFGVDKPIEIINLVKKIVEVSGKLDSRVKILNTAKAEIRDQYLSSEKAREILKWRPRYTLEEGLKETYEWYKEYFKK